MGDSEPAAVKNHAAFIWSVADLLRGDYRRSEYGRVILPLTAIRRLDCVLEPTKSKVLAVRDQFGDRETLLRSAAGVDVYNTSKLTLSRILDDPATIADQLRAYLAAFSPNARDVIDKFDFTAHIARLNQSNLLYLVLARFCDLDLHPDVVSDVEMGAIYEELIRRSFEAENETAGEHFTPREVIRLMVNLLFCDDDDMLRKRGILRTLLDPACGTGGMLSVAEDRLRELNSAATLQAHGQELNARTYAICRSDMMIKGEQSENIAFGNSFTGDAFVGQHFDYLLANPPFGVEWKKVADEVRAEQRRGFGGRFGAGLPRINDGSFLFLQHMISKMKRPEEGGSRLAIVFNGSPLFTGAAGSGESEIRRWIIENDWLEAVVALPDQLFYNTGISTYFWVVTNRKNPQRRGKVQLIDAREFFTKMRKSLGEKRKEISAAQIAEIVRLYGEFTENEKTKIMPNEAFGFLRITVERPLRLRWTVSADTLAAFDTDAKLAKLLVPESRAALRAELTAWGEESFTDRKLAAKRIKDSLLHAGAGGSAVEKALLDVLAVRDPDAEPVTDFRGQHRARSRVARQRKRPSPARPSHIRGRPVRPARLGRVPGGCNGLHGGRGAALCPRRLGRPHQDQDRLRDPLTRHFYKYVLLRPLAEIDAEIKQLESEIQALLNEVTE